MHKLNKVKDDINKKLSFKLDINEKLQIKNKFNLKIKSPDNKINKNQYKKINYKKIKNLLSKRINIDIYQKIKKINNNKSRIKIKKYNNIKKDKIGLKEKFYQLQQLNDNVNINNSIDNERFPNKMKLY